MYSRRSLPFYRKETPQRLFALQIYGDLSVDLLVILVADSSTGPRHLWDTRLNTLPTSVPDTTSGPSAPDVEIISCAVAFYRHAVKFPPRGTKSFSAVNSLEWLGKRVVVEAHASSCQ